MKQLHYITFIISLFLLLVNTNTTFAQSDSLDIKVIDSVKYKQTYGVRVGVDLSKIAKTIYDDDYTGFEINGDYRINKKWFIAAELGNENKNTITDYLDIKTKGSYIKAGADYNMYTNWLDMENMIYAGFRVGASSFSQTLNEYSVFNTNHYWESQYSSTESQEFSGLNAIWAELQLGLKAEVLNNLFVGINVQLKRLITESEPDNFENVFIPGFNKTYDSNSIGVGYNYSISYLIPLFKK